MMKKLSRYLLNFVSTTKEAEIIEARLQEGSNNRAAQRLGIPRRTVDRAVNRVMKRAEEAGVSADIESAKILAIDIETAPLLSYLWSLWPNGGVNPQMVEAPSYVLSWAAKWIGGDEVFVDALCFDEDYEPGIEDDLRMLTGIWHLLDEADFVVGHNGDRFDIKRLNTRFLLAGLNPPSPYRQIDTLKMVKRCFAFDSNKLDYLLRQICGRAKGESGGFETWRRVMAGDMDAWDQLVRYNMQDVVDLEEVYLAIRSWDKSHPNVATAGAERLLPVCTTCGSENLIPTLKTSGTNASKFPLYQCGDCGTHVRGRKSVLTKEAKAALMMRAR